MGTRQIRCFGCGGLVPDITGPTHRYLEAAPGCWQAYGEVLAREYSDRAYAAVHRLTVDAYSVQHPSRPSPQTIQSVWVHLLGLHLVLEKGAHPTYATRAMGAALKHKGRLQWLTPPRSLGEVTVMDVVPCTTLAAHGQKVRAWAESAWQAWAVHHDAIRQLATFE